MHSKLQKKTVGPAICRRSWRLCSTVKTKALTKTPPPFLQPSYALRSGLNNRVPLGAAPRVIAGFPAPSSADNERASSGGARGLGPNGIPEYSGALPAGGLHRGR